jgi:hypothetical protein
MAELNVHVVFKDERQDLDEKLPTNYAPGGEQKACMQALAMLQATGGIMHFEKDGIEWVPMDNVFSIKITAPEVVSATMADLSNLTMPVKR